MHASATPTVIGAMLAKRAIALCTTQQFVNAQENSSQTSTDILIVSFTSFFMIERMIYLVECHQPFARHMIHRLCPPANTPATMCSA